MADLKEDEGEWANRDEEHDHTMDDDEEDEEEAAEWKANIPLLYDWFANHHLLWPSLSCR